jgi:hypothetical protein
MLYAMICTDKPGALPIRQATRPSHLDYLKGFGDRVRAAGPLLDDAGAAPVGSLIIIEAGSLEGARAIAAADPYALAGLFAQVEIRPWTWAVNNPRG